MHVLLLSSFKKGPNVLLETDLNTDRSVNRLFSFFKTLTPYSDNPAAVDRTVKYMHHLLQKTLHKCASRDFYLRCLVERNKNVDPKGSMRIIYFCISVTFFFLTLINLKNSAIRTWLHASWNVISAMFIRWNLSMYLTAFLRVYYSTKSERNPFW